MENTLRCKDFLNEFEQVTRTNGNKIWVINDMKTPLYEAIKKAHGNRLPNDFIFETAHDYLQKITEYDEINEDTQNEIIESLLDFENYKLIQWLGNGGYNADYVNEAVNEQGGRCNDFNIIEAIIDGQRKHIQEICACIDELFL